MPFSVSPAIYQPFQQCLALSLWLNAALGVGLPLLILRGFEQRSRTHFEQRQRQQLQPQSQRQQQRMQVDECREPALLPVFLRSYLFSCLFWVAGTGMLVIIFHD